MDPQRGGGVIYQINFMGRNWDINGPTNGWWSYLSNKFYGRGGGVIYQINFMGRNWDINGPTKGC